MDITSYKFASIFGTLLSNLCVNINWQQCSNVPNNFMFPNMHGMTHTKWVLHLLFSDTMYIWLIAMQSFFCTCLVQSCPVIVCHVQGLLLIQSMEVFQAWSAVLLFSCQQPLYAQSYYIVFDTRNPDYITTIIKVHSVLITRQLSSNNYKKIWKYYGLLNDGRHLSPFLKILF